MKVLSATRSACDDDFIRMVAAGRADAKCYTFKSRFKSWQEIEKKVRRKRLEGEAQRELYCADLARFGLDDRSVAAHDLKDEFSGRAERIAKLLEYNPEHLTDVWGCRFVTLYQSEIPIIAGSLLNAIARYNASANEPVQMKEFVIYTNRPVSDPLSIVTDTLAAVKHRPELSRSVLVEDRIIRPPENRKSAYSSVHFVFSRGISEQREDEEEDLDRIFFEVQLRDIFEEGWGEVQHDLLYSFKDSSGSFDALDSDGSGAVWRPHLNALKTFVDGCSQHASIIKGTWESARRRALPKFETRSATSRVEDRDRIVAALKLDGARRDVWKMAAKAYALLLAAEASGEDHRQAAPVREYEEAAAALSEAKAIAADRLGLEVPSTGRTIGYFFEIELANCLFVLSDLSAERQDIAIGARELEAKRLLKDAIGSYERIVAGNPQDPVVYTRLGRALLTCDRSPDSLTRIENLLDRAVELIPGDLLTGPLHWINISIRTQRAYIIWHQALQTAPEDGPRRSDFMRRAIAEIMIARSFWKNELSQRDHTTVDALTAHKALSSLIFYLADFILHGYVHPNFDRETLSLIMEDLDGLQIPPFAEYFRSRDNVMHARLALGDEVEARRLALATFGELRELAEARSGFPLDRDSVPAHLRTDERTCFLAAGKQLFR